MKSLYNQVANLGDDEITEVRAGDVKDVLSRKGYLRRVIRESIHHLLKSTDGHNHTGKELCDDCLLMNNLWDVYNGQTWRIPLRHDLPSKDILLESPDDYKDTK
jgi:hypothetical protein